jgi:23S rRNA pseudouridine1911/1915/1917 synthase
LVVDTDPGDGDDEDATIYELTSGPSDAGTRLDQFLAGRDLPLTRSQLKRHIEAGRATVAGLVAKPSRKLRDGEVVVLEVPAPAASELVAQDIPLTILFEDQHLVAIDKPAGLVVHPAAGHPDGTLVNALLFHCKDLAGIGGELRPGIVHRLDRDTTGVMVAAKDDPTHVALARAFKDKDLLRLYRAVVHPAPRAASGIIDTTYGRHPRDRKKFTSRVGGKRAITHWRVLERLVDDAAVVECRLSTGRTHQIRVHMSESGWPLLGDQTYGKTPATPRLIAAARQIGRQALHAAVLELVHPITGVKLAFESALPPDMATLVDDLRPHDRRTAP